MTWVWWRSLTYPDHGDKNFLWNFDTLLKEHTALHFRRWWSPGRRQHGEIHISLLCDVTREAMSVRLNILDVERQQLLPILSVCMQSYTSWKALAPYHIVICAVSVSTTFSHIISQTVTFRAKSYWTQNVFWYSVQLLPEKSLILGRNERDMIISVYWSSCKVPVILATFEWKLNFLNRFSKSTQIPNFIKIRPVGAKLFHADGQIDRHDGANSQFSQFCESA